MALLIDTSAVITVERRGVPLAQALRDLPDDQLSISAISVSELLVGVHRATSEERRRERSTFLEDLIGRLRVLPVDLTVARVHARLLARLAISGVTVGTHDLLIGATAIAHEAIVVTENLRDFGRIPDLRVVRPTW